MPSLVPGSDGRRHRDDGHGTPPDQVDPEVARAVQFVLRGGTCRTGSPGSRSGQAIGDGIGDVAAALSSSCSAWNAADVIRTDSRVSRESHTSAGSLAGAIAGLAGSGVQVFVEIGPHPTTAALIRVSILPLEEIHRALVLPWLPAEVKRGYDTLRTSAGGLPLRAWAATST